MFVKKAPETRLHILLLILGIVVGLALGRTVFPGKKPPELPAPSRAGMQTDLDAFFPRHYSERNEEVIIRHFFKDRRDGFFLDVGAYHYKNASNTYYLEKNLGWSGIAVDANGEFALGYKRNRPKTLFFSFFISDKSDEKADFLIVREPGHLTKSTAVRDFVPEREVEEVKVPTITLNDLLAGLHVKKIDFLNMDIELWEPRALAGFDIERYKPDLVCIEAHRQVRDRILAYFEEHGYARMDLYFLFDQRNWYFAPADEYRRKFDVDY